VVPRSPTVWTDPPGLSVMDSCVFLGTDIYLFDGGALSPFEVGFGLTPDPVTDPKYCSPPRFCFFFCTDPSAVSPVLPLRGFLSFFLGANLLEF